MSQIVSLLGQRLAFKAAVAGLAFCGVFASAQPAQAVPLLQLYIEGGTYVDGDEESWTLSLNAGESFKVWAVSNGGDVSNVKLSVASTTLFAVGDVEILGSQVTQTEFEDGSQSADPGYTGVFSGGKGPGATNPPLPPHGIFNQNAPVYWQEFSLGNFTGSSAKIVNFNEDFILGDPLTGKKKGEIYAYQVTAKLPMNLHFDLWGFKSNGKIQHAPFSHDAIVSSTGNGGNPGPGPLPAPEPASLALLAMGCFGLGGYGWRKRNIVAK